ncbi:MAG: hypothetical protein O3C21_02800 [Verrucomicrobia bacterium]|nr:hypothetical protein [Verrucomicrobiota bacterium]
MLEIRELTLPIGHTDAELRQAAAAAIGTHPEGIGSLTIWKRAIDARKRDRVSFNYTVHVDAEPGTTIRNKAHVGPAPDRIYRELDGLRSGNREKDARPVIVGLGPCGLFAGLVLARMGFAPRIFERGKAAGPRARDVTGFWRRGVEFNPESNVQFGEGGAGTFSDGKLYTQTKDREHRRPWILHELVAAGAPEDILLKARPHIGTDRLIKVVRHLREEIIALGGEVHFESRVDAVLLDANRQVQGIRLANGDTIETRNLVLAIGHSARETFSMIHASGVFIEPKAFSIGVRIEHPQSMIDRAQYGRFTGLPELGSAPYKFVQHLGARRSAYSFCMCPGGLVVASSSEPGGVVTNGMSSYARAEANANSGFMIDVLPEDFCATDANPLAGIAFQRKWEKRAFEVGGGDYKAPAQKLGDLMRRKASRNFGDVVPSYEPGVVPANLDDCLPQFVTNSLRKAVSGVDKKLKGFALPDAVVTGVETRSSSPIRITRDPASLQSVNTPGLYPAGEGAGYAGGIISAAIDGMRVAEQIVRSMQ